MDEEREAQIERNAAESSVKKWKERFSDLPDEAQVCYVPANGDHMIALNSVELRQHEGSGMIFALLFYRSPEEEEDGTTADQDIPHD